MAAIKFLSTVPVNVQSATGGHQTQASLSLVDVREPVTGSRDIVAAIIGHLLKGTGLQ